MESALVVGFDTGFDFLWRQGVIGVEVMPVAVIDPGSSGGEPQELRDQLAALPPPYTGPGWSPGRGWMFPHKPDQD